MGQENVYSADRISLVKSECYKRIKGAAIIICSRRFGFSFFVLCSDCETVSAVFYLKISALQNRGEGAEIECRAWNSDDYIAGTLHGGKARFCGGGSEPGCGLERG